MVAAAYAGKQVANYEDHLAGKTEKINLFRSDEVMVHNPQTKTSKYIPKEVDHVLEYLDSHNGAAQPGYKGNRIYDNNPRESWHQKLPGGTVYREYDIYPHIKGQDRGKLRVVVGEDGTVWFTDNHYITFDKIK